MSAWAVRGPPWPLVQRLLPAARLPHLSFPPPLGRGRGSRGLSEPCASRWRHRPALRAGAGTPRGQALSRGQGVVRATGGDSSGLPTSTLEMGDAFVVPDEHRGAAGDGRAQMWAEGVPIIDISPLLNGDPDMGDGWAGLEAKEAIEAIGAAARDWGFFQVTGHGLDVQPVLEEVEGMFAMPLEWKKSFARGGGNPRGYFNDELTKQIRDFKECFDFGQDEPSEVDGTNVWPAPGSGRPGFEPSLRAHYAACEGVAAVLLRAIVTSLGLPPARYAAAFEGGHSSMLRLNHYPPCPDPARALGISRHTDAGVLTVLHQDRPGLQVQRGGTWYDVPPVPGAMVINIGDVVQVWTNGRYVAPVHRVLASAPGTDRYSIPFFYQPSHATTYAPAPELLTPGAEGAEGGAKYRPINWGEFRRLRALGDMEDVGAEVQIADWEL